MDAKRFINEILDYFEKSDRDPGGDWAFPDDFSSLGLDFQGRDGAVFWIDIDREGHVKLVWRNPAGEHQSMTFVAH